MTDWFHLLAVQWTPIYCKVKLDKSNKFIKTYFRSLRRVEYIYFQEIQLQQNRLLQEGSEFPVTKSAETTLRRMTGQAEHL